MERMKSPEAEAGGGTVVEPRRVAENAIRDCGGLVAAIEWARTWAHRTYFAEVLEILQGIRAARDLVRLR